MRNLSVLSLVAVIVSVALAATPIATVVSGEGLTIRGTPVPATGVPSWPVASGDELASGTSPAVVMFKDQSRLTLEAATRVKLEQRHDHICVFVIAGSIKLEAVAGAHMTVCGLGKCLIPQTPFEGTITMEAPANVKIDAVQGTMAEGKNTCSESPLFAAHSGKKAAIIILVGGAAAGTAAGIALTRGGNEARSPSR